MVAEVSAGPYCWFAAGCLISYAHSPMITCSAAAAAANLQTQSAPHLNEGGRCKEKGHSTRGCERGRQGQQQQVEEGGRGKRQER